MSVARLLRRARALVRRSLFVVGCNEASSLVTHHLPLFCLFCGLGWFYHQRLSVYFAEILLQRRKAPVVTTPGTDRPPTANRQQLSTDHYPLSLRVGGWDSGTREGERHTKPLRFKELTLSHGGRMIAPKAHRKLRGPFLLGGLF